MTPRPELAVVITAHNAAATLGATLRALAAQTASADGSTEVVVVDDRSSDQTARVVDSLQHTHIRVLRIDGVPSPNTCTARQYALDVGVRATRAPHILVLDADALPPRGWVSAVHQALGDAQCVACGVEFIASERSRSGRTIAALQTVDAAYYMQWCRTLSQAGAASGILFGAAGFRRELYERVGGFCALGFTLLEDLAFARAIHALGERIRFAEGEPVSVRASERWRDMIERALRTGTTGGRSLLAAALGIWGLLLPALGIAAIVAGGAWLLAFGLRYLAGVGIAALGLRRIRRLRHMPVALIYEPAALVLASIVAAATLRSREIEWGGVRYPRQRSFSVRRA